MPVIDYKYFNKSDEIFYLEKQILKSNIKKDKGSMFYG